MNGAGNSFLLVDARKTPLDVTPKKMEDWSKVYDFDQLLVLEASNQGDARYRIWNRDGGEVGACGNGARCAAWYLMESIGRSEIFLDAAYGLTAAKRTGPTSISVDLGEARTAWNEIPLARHMDTVALDFMLGAFSGPGAVSMGNPHIVFFVPSLEALPIAQLGPVAEHDPLFPERVNVGFAEVQTHSHIRLRVWERGAGLTLACGTGAAAAVVAGVRQQRLERKCRVDVDGGQLSIEWQENNHVWLEGPIEFNGEVQVTDQG